MTTQPPTPEERLTTTPIPDFILDKMCDFTGDEITIIFAMMSKKINWNNYLNDIEFSDQEVFELLGVETPKTACIEGLRGLVNHKVIREIESGERGVKRFLIMTKDCGKS